MWRRPFIGAKRLDALKDRKLAAQPGKETSFPGLPSGERSKGTLRALYREFHPDKTASKSTLKFAHRICPEFSYQFTLPEEGVKEIRNASHSFNLMREQVLGNLEERNRMFSAMTHDLRTPLTKLQLRLERVQPQELREKLQATTAEMSSIIVQGLEFARSLTTNEKPIRLELVSFLQSLVDDATDVGGKVALQCEGIGEEKTVVVSARTLCLRRCLENLISNANKYAGEAKVVLQKDAEGVVISVLDNGPGIPEEKLETVFEPYYRLESSRNSTTGGTGLGLCIARNMAALNGAELTLTNREEGGLCAQVRFLRR